MFLVNKNLYGIEKVKTKKNAFCFLPTNRSLRNNNNIRKKVKFGKRKKIHLSKKKKNKIYNYGKKSIKKHHEFFY